jgi:hypothetical protein
MTAALRLRATRWLSAPHCIDFLSLLLPYYAFIFIIILLMLLIHAAAIYAG